ncbi:hypothetical protein KKH27_01875 [bacterium]|nr:hypothetical protein [bacterium]MBU1984952.1 hypothetical protein [bacterium]
MKTRAPTGAKELRSARGRRWQRGFTLVSTAINFTVAGVVLTGAWIAYNNMQVQWKVTNADRMMDQYAASAMQELTNVLSWGWGGEGIQGGRNTRWKFSINDLVEEHGLMQQWRYRTIPALGYRYIELTCQPQKGILFNGGQPKWVHGYLWSGSTPRYLQSRVFDSRDRMTVEGFGIDYYLYPEFPAQNSREIGAAQIMLNRRMLAKVTITLHYTYNAPEFFGKTTTLFGSRYVRERKYETTVCMRNWWVENNEYYDHVLGRSGYGSG